MKKKPVYTATFTYSTIEQAVSSAIRIYSQLWKPRSHVSCQISKKKHSILILSRSWGDYRINYRKGVDFTKETKKDGRLKAFEVAVCFLYALSDLEDVHVSLKENAQRLFFTVFVNKFPLLRCFYSQSNETDDELLKRAEAIKAKNFKENDSHKAAQLYAAKIKEIIRSADIPIEIRLIPRSTDIEHTESITLDRLLYKSSSEAVKTGKYYEKEPEDKNKTIKAPVILRARSIHVKQKPHKLSHPWLENWNDRFDHDD